MLTLLTNPHRTAKFMAFQHYPGFWPDGIIIGKAMQVSALLMRDKSGVLDVKHEMTTMNLGDVERSHNLLRMWEYALPASEGKARGAGVCARVELMHAAASKVLRDPACGFERGEQAWGSGLIRFATLEPDGAPAAACWVHVYGAFVRCLLPLIDCPDAGVEAYVRQFLLGGE